jgi:hypothetical protein
LGVVITSHNHHFAHYYLVAVPTVSNDDVQRECRLTAWSLVGMIIIKNSFESTFYIIMYIRLRPLFTHLHVCSYDILRITDNSEIK